MLSEPSIQDRPAAPTLGIGVRCHIAKLAEVVPPLFPELFGWLAAHDVAHAGPPFVRYYSMAMEGELDVEVGVAVVTEHPGDVRVHTGTIEAGRYAALVQTGPPDQVAVGNAALQQWGSEHGLLWKMEHGQWAGRFEFSLLSPDEQPDVNLWETEIAYLIQ